MEMTPTMLFIVALGGAFFTAVISYLASRLKVKNDRETFYENKISEILEIQSKEIHDLKAEVEKLVKENLELRKQLEKGNYYNEKHTS